MEGASGADLKEYKVWMSSWCTPSVLLQFISITQKKLMHSPEALISVTAKGTPSDHLALVGSRTYA